MCDLDMQFASALPALQNCERRAMVRIGQPIKDIYASSFLFQPEIQGIPVSIFVSSSLFLTVIFYLAMFVFVISSALARVYRLFAFERQVLDIEKFPFTVAAIYLIIAAAPLTLAITLVLDRVLA
jgi:hypothetical protein